MKQSQTTLDLIARVDADGSCFYESGATLAIV